MDIKTLLKKQGYNDIQIKKLIDLKYSDNNKPILKLKDEVLYWLLSSKDTNNINAYDYLIKRDYKDKKDLLNNRPILSKDLEKYHNLIENMEFPQPLQEGLECKKCSRNTFYYVNIQTRAADEGMTGFGECKSCGYKTRKN